MSWVDRLNTNLRGTINKESDNILESRSGIKADQNLERLADLVENVLENKIEKTVRVYTKKIFYFQKKESLQMIHLHYHLENRLLSKVYDLHVEGRVENVFQSEFENGDIIFKYGTLFNQKEPHFVYRTKTQEVDERVTKLNNPLIIDRIRKLDLSEILLQYSKDEKLWKISSRSIIGSSVSLMFPPLTRCITMQTQEIILLYELYSMIAAVLKHTGRKG